MRLWFNLPSAARRRRGAAAITRTAVLVLAALVVVPAMFAQAPDLPNKLFWEPFDVNKTRIRLTPGERWGLFRASDIIHIEASNNAAFVVMSLRGAVVYDGRASSLKLPTGHYFVQTKGDRTQFAVLPDDYKGAPFLGAEADDRTDSQYTEKLQQIQPAWVRVMGQGYWPIVEPQRGKWDWKQLDQVVEANKGRKIIVMAFLRPDWLKDDHDFTQSYPLYVGRMARRYAGKIYAIEVWNEPWYEGNPQYSLPGKDWQEMLGWYVDLLRDARRAIRKESDQIRVFGPAMGPSYWSDVTAKFVELGGKSLVDGYTYHDYSTRTSPPDQAKRFSESVVVPAIDGRVAAHRAALGDMPILVDEVGLFGKSALGCPNSTNEPMYASDCDWHRGMCRAIKFVVLYRAAGIDALIPHVFALFSQYPNPNIEIYGWDCSEGVKSAPRGPHPKTSAFLMACYWLNGAKFIEKRALGQNALLFGWQRPDGSSLAFAWCLEGTTVPYAPDKHLLAKDIFGNALTPEHIGEEPVLFQTDADSGVQALLDSLEKQIR